MLLLTGPTGSGKTRHVLERVREALASRRTDFRLLVPTATMAEHIRNELAREGFVPRRSLIGTLSGFVEQLAGDTPQVTGGQLNLIVEEVLASISPNEFREVASLPGFRTALAGLIDELTSAGCDSVQVRAAVVRRLPGRTLAAAFGDVFEEAERSWRRRGAAARGERLRFAASRIREQGLPGVRAVYMDGFFTLSQPEIELVEALRAHADLTVTLPRWEGSQQARARLLGMGFVEEEHTRARQQPRIVLLAARTTEEELGEIARRILAEASAGRPFREMGVVVRSREPYVPALRAVLERFGIPARFYFAEPPVAYSPVRYLAGAVDAMLGGWDHEETLGVLRMTSSAAGRCSDMDRFDFEVRKNLPGRGLAPLRLLARHPAIRTLIDSLAPLDAWREGECQPGEWATRVKNLSSRLFRPVAPSDSPSRSLITVWRGQAAALRAWEGAANEAAAALDGKGPVAFEPFWHAVNEALSETNVRVPDQRRNVVHVLDVYEARQWELPVVFVCGLLERQFPLYHPQDPVLPDNVRSVLRQEGVTLRTAAERDREERFLFDLAVSRATSTLVLSYPQFNESGDANLRSFFLDEIQATAVQEQSRPVRLAGGPTSRVDRPVVIRDPGLLDRLVEKHASTSSSAVEGFLQCPFLFFARNTLGLEGPPRHPSERFDQLAQGDVIHCVLALCIGSGVPLEEAFDAELRWVYKERGIPDGYRREAIRLELFRDLRRFLTDLELPPASKRLYEHSFQFTLREGVRLRGRMDRVDVYEDGLALVVDYKYSHAQKVRDRRKGTEQGRFVQAGLYLLAVKQVLGHEPAGMLFAGLRRETSLEGWHLPLPGLEAGADCTSEVLAELSATASGQVAGVLDAVHGGRIAPSPADERLCEYCEFVDICRVESATGATAAGGFEE
ncbi:MAG TPA: PD-(D/E)XK nuclease family protein [Bryobacteraceae bacterium]|nr:PD-(D/E)XK nuclease family protein [Bryobacteraceae bacterium]